MDGFRIDTVKHMEIGATRHFVSTINEFAQTIGKEDFLLLGEITGGRDFAVDTLEKTGLTAALGIGDVPDQLEFLAKGFRQPTTGDRTGYFDLFRNSITVGKSSHAWFGRHVVTMFDDHDRVARGAKVRFCGDEVNDGRRSLDPALGLNLLSAGIPCIYYGTEQAFDSGSRKSWVQQASSMLEDRAFYAYLDRDDRKLRECMFGGPFGSFGSSGCHFFDERHPAYRRIQELTEVRRRYLPLRRGRQYLRDISGSGNPGEFGAPHLIGGVLRTVVPWSRILDDDEILVAINTDPSQALTVWVTVEASLHPPGTDLRLLYSTDSSVSAARVQVEDRNGRRVVRITLPPAGIAVYR